MQYKFSSLMLLALGAALIAPILASPTPAPVPEPEPEPYYHHGKKPHHYGKGEYSETGTGCHTCDGGSTEHGGGHNGGHTTPPPPPSPPSSTSITRAVVALRRYEADGWAEGGALSHVYFTQDWEHGPVTLKGEIIGLDLPAGKSIGWHIHEYGDITGGCATAGGHWNPEGVTHGSPDDESRHVGDLGMLYVGPDGDAYVDNISNNKLALTGLHSIIGRTLVIHANEDDFGKGGKPDSLTTGAAGGRIACGIIGVAKAA